MKVEEIKVIIEKVEGWLKDREGMLLYNLAKNCQGRGKIVEIGSWKGKSTIWIGHGSKEGKNVDIFAIDPHIGTLYVEGEKFSGTFAEFKNNISYAKVDDIITPIVKTSEDAAKDFNHPIEFIFIDGLHEYECVKLDFSLWFPKVINGGIMAFHDYYNFGVTRFVKEYIIKSKHFKNIGLTESILYAQKVEKNSIYDRIRNRLILSAKVGFMTNIIKNETTKKLVLALPKPLRKLIKKVLGF
ncbi:MAG: class I SAM-dependent methyltransferase [Clostridia bacterium]|nr:class I SAM-dependent methyltransferase [Clostridia bacterium]